MHTAFWVLMLLAFGAAGFWAKENLAWRNVQTAAAGFSVNWRHVQASVAGAMQRWHSKWLSVEPAPPPVSAPVPASKSVPASVPANGVKIRCQRCGGLGFAVFTAKKTTVDLEKRKHTVTETKREACLLCDQKGGRTIILPAGAEICPACYGMGRIVSVLNGREQVLSCEICLGKGDIIRKY